jgi:hypothetical protein
VVAWPTHTGSASPPVPERVFGQAAWLLCLIAGLTGDRPAMISGATGAVAVVMPTITRKCIDYSALYGGGCPWFPDRVAIIALSRVISTAAAGPAAPCTEPRFATPTRLGVLFYAIILQGILQFVFGMLQMGKFALLLPHPSMVRLRAHDWLARLIWRRTHQLSALGRQVGFCNGLGLIIFFAQFEAFKLGAFHNHQECTAHISAEQASGEFKFASRSPAQAISDAPTRPTAATCSTIRASGRPGFRSVRYMVICDGWLNSP